MSLARIVARSPQVSNLLARKLRARGFQIEAYARRVEFTTSPDIEFSVEESTIENALEQAGRTGTWVFIAPGALADGVSEVIDFTPEETKDAVPEPSAGSPILPSIMAEAPVSGPVTEVVSEPVGISAAEIESVEIQSVPPEAVVVASTAATISDLAPALETCDPVAVRDLTMGRDLAVDSNENREIPTPLEIAPVLAEAMATDFEEPVAAVEVHTEEIIQSTEVEAKAVKPSGQLISEIVEPPAIVFETSAEVPVAAELAALPASESLPEPAQARPVALEREAEIVVEKAAADAPATHLASRKIRIVLPGFKRNAYLWASAALVFTIGVMGMVVTSTKPASHPVSAAQPQITVAPQTPLRIANAPSVARKAGAPAASQAVSSVPRHHSTSSDEGYIAKDTVVRYGSSAATPPRKSAAKGKSIQN